MNLGIIVYSMSFLGIARNEHALIGAYRYMPMYTKQLPLLCPEH